MQASAKAPTDKNRDFFSNGNETPSLAPRSGSIPSPHLGAIGEPVGVDGQPRSRQILMG